MVNEDDMKQLISNALATYMSGILDASEIESMLETPPDESMGDFAIPCFSLARVMRKSPQKIAADFATSMQNVPLFSRVEAAGGYLNLVIHRQRLSRDVLIQALQDDYGKQTHQRTVVVEYCSPNTNKPLHLGHLRNMAIGESVAHILKFMGNTVTKTCIFNDRGVHICKSMVAYQQFGQDATPLTAGKKSDHFVGDYYVLFARKSKEDATLESQAQQMLADWEAGDASVRDLWKTMNTWAFDGFAETFGTFGTSFDKEYFESQIYTHGRSAILDGLQRGVFTRRADGAVVADLTASGLDEKVLLRSDGTSVYIVQDIYLAQQKKQDFDYDESIYVVGNEQDYHFKVLKEVLRMSGADCAEGIRHLSYGMVELPEGKMKSREGTVVDADDLIASTAEMAAEEIRKRQNIDESEIQRRGLVVALAAIKYQLLKTETAKNMLFNPREAIRFEGDTGPYLLYSYARAASILRKAAQQPDVSGWDANEYEARVLKAIARFPEVVALAAQRLTPSLLAVYVTELCQAFNQFFHECPVLRSDIAAQRLAMVAAFKQVVGDCLHLLGIEVLEEM
jgi:arginyl-tRNA synthetase